MTMRLTRRGMWWAAFFAVLLAAAATAGFWLYSQREAAPKEAAAQPAIERFQLKNGLQVVLIPNHRLPIVNHTLWIKTGAADDPQGQSGLAHYLEHMMFKGTGDVPEGEFSRRISSRGGIHNAFTAADYTGYYATIAKEHLPEVMRLEADRLTGLAAKPEDFLSERKVILEERKLRVDNQPLALLAEQMNAALYLNHPYGRPIIGWMHEMKTLSQDAVMALYRRAYQPGAMVLIVAGDVTRPELEKLARRYYGGLRGQEPAAREWTREPPARAAREVLLSHVNVKQPIWRRSYLAPSLAQGDGRRSMALSLLAQMLGGGDASLLHRRLVVEQQLATSAIAYYSGLTRGPAQFLIQVEPREGVTREQISGAVDAIMASLSKTLPEPAELARAQTLFKAEAVFARDGLEHVADFVGRLMMIGLDEQYFLEWEARVDAVTGEDVRRAAKAALTPERSVTGWLEPRYAH